MIKRELVNDVSARLRVTQQQTASVVQNTLDVIAEFLVAGHRIEIRNFGVFEVRRREPRRARNPRTGAQVLIGAKFIPAFKPGKALKVWVQAGSRHSELPSVELSAVDPAEPGGLEPTIKGGPGESFAESHKVRF